jgi:hypothetical protein
MLDELKEGVCIWGFSLQFDGEDGEGEDVDWAACSIPVMQV